MTEHLSLDIIQQQARSTISVEYISAFLNVGTNFSSSIKLHWFANVKILSLNENILEQNKKLKIQTV